MIALGCDHGGYELKQEIIKYLEENNIEYKDFGCDSTDSTDYPIYAKRVAIAIQNGDCEKGILICGTGVGISIAAMELKDLFTDVKLLKFALIKLLAVPVAAMLLVCQVIDNQLICEVFLVMMATPAASMCAMLSQQYGGDYELAAKGVALTTILSVVTMPIVSEIVCFMIQ